MKEIWKDIKGYENLYEISNFGNVRNKNKQIKKQYEDIKCSEHTFNNNVKRALEKNGIYYGYHFKRGW